MSTTKSAVTGVTARTSPGATGIVLTDYESFTNVLTYRTVSKVYSAMCMLLFRQSFELADAYVIVLLLCYLACMSLRLFVSVCLSVSLSLTGLWTCVCMI